MALNIVRDIDGDVEVRNVLISVSDKQGLDQLVPGLLAAGPHVRIFSTGGTYELLRKLPGIGNQLVPVSDFTGQPEMQGGLVKTLDFKIYLGLLSETYNDAHQGDLARTGAVAIDMVVVNLYPFRETVAKAGVTTEEARTNIDIGGPCMIRAAAKNYLRVASVTDPADYPGILKELAARDGKLGLSTRLGLMRKAFAHTAAYDAAIAQYFGVATELAVRACYDIR
jgi:phosphoribosylaminoimidazolecarboxamide formyltransferase / IMP cyclohydrolase